MITDRLKDSTINKLLHVGAFTPNEANITADIDGRWGSEIHIISDSGVGKSSMVRAFAKSRGLECITFYGSRCGPQDIAMLIPDNEGVLRYNINEIAQQVMDKRNTVLFLDEASEARSEVQAMFMSLCLERSIGSQVLPGSCTPILAANPAAIACGGFRLERPLANRLINIDVDKLIPAINRQAGWANYMKNLATQTEVQQIIDPDEERARVAAAWQSCFSAATIKITEFISSHPNMLHPELEGAWRPKNVSDLSFPTERSNTKAAYIVASAYIHCLPSKIRRAMLEGCCGTEWLDKFLQFEATYGELPNTEQFLDGAAAYNHNPGRPDYAICLFTSCVNVCSADEDTIRKQKRIGKLWQALGEVTDKDNMIVDLLAPTLHEMTSKANEGVFMTGQHFSASIPILAKLNKVTDLKKQG